MASLTVLTAIIITRIQHQALLESRRPELVFSEASYAFKESDVIAVYINRLTNVGRGAALGININCDPKEVDNISPVSFPTLNFPILASNETVDLTSGITLYWKNLPENQKTFSLRILIRCTDTRGIVYVVDYSYFIERTHLSHLEIHEPMRHVYFDSVFMRKIKICISKIPLIGSLIDKERNYIS